MEKTEGFNTLVKLIGVLSSSFESFREEQRRELAEIRLELGGLRGELNGLKADFVELREEFTELKVDFAGLRLEFEELRSEFAGLRSEFEVLRADVNRDIGKLRLEITRGLERQERLSLSILEVLGTSLEDLDTRVSKLEAVAA